MGVRIEFRGNLLFRYKDGVLKEVLLPNCWDRTKVNGPAKGGKQHHAGILIERKRDGRRFPLKLPPQSILQIVGGTDPVPFPEGVAVLLPPMNDLGQCVLPEKRAATVQMFGLGHWETVPELTGSVKFREHVRPVVLSLIYEMESARILGVPELSGSDQNLADGDWACIYSYEVDPPQATRPDLYAVKPMESDGPTRDTDFEWIYTLFANSDVNDLRPVPEINPDPSWIQWMPNVSTCFPAATKGGT